MHFCCIFKFNKLIITDVIWKLFVGSNPNHIYYYRDPTDVKHKAIVIDTKGVGLYFKKRIIHLSFPKWFTEKLL